MCGIFGVIGSNVKYSEVSGALKAIRHRGPDDEGVLMADWRSGRFTCLAGDDTSPELLYRHVQDFDASEHACNLFLGHRRLSILDLSIAGHQPMTTDDQRYWIVYNGEIYNYLEIRAQLENEGISFKTGTDTEVLLQAYRKWGEKCVNYLVGMWAFCIWDRDESTLFFSRDPFGIKPLYWTNAGGRLSFSSEIKSLLMLPWVSKRAEMQSVYDYLCWGCYHRTNGKTMFEDIFELPPACNAVIELKNSNNEWKYKRYWDINLEEKSNLSFADAAAKLRDTFMESVKLHMRSDVSVGVTLSGGIDSSGIACAMRSIGGKDLNISSFSYLPNDDKINEKKWVEIAAKASDARQYHTEGRSIANIENLRGVVRCQDLPFGSASICAQHDVFKLVAESGIKVTLDGQGPDEMLAGYTGFYENYAISLTRSGKWQSAYKMAALAKVSVMRVLMKAAAPNFIHKIKACYSASAAVPPWLHKQWVKDNHLLTTYPDQKMPRKDILRNELKTELLHVSIPVLMRYADRNSMMFGIESRVPYLTKEIAELALSLNESYYIGEDGATKNPLRHALKGLVPDQILDRRDKIGFSAPNKSLMMLWRTDFATIGRYDSGASALLNFEYINQVMQSCAQGETPYSAWMWQCMNLILWQKEFDVEFN